MRRSVEPRVFSLHLADVSFPEGHPQEGDPGPVRAFVVVSRDGILLYDTGLGEGEPEIDEQFDPACRSLPDELATHGINLGDVTAVANSHLHFDHCGRNTLFPRKPVFVQSSEYRAAREPRYTVPAWVEFPGAAYELVDGEVEVLQGVRLLPTPGHTPGHQSLVVEATTGTTVVAGQAVYTSAEWQGSTDPRRSGQRSAWDPQAYAESVRRLRELDPTMVLFSHDLTGWKRT